MKRVDDLDVAGQTVFLRADLNVPTGWDRDHRRRPDPGQSPHPDHPDQPRGQGRRLCPPRQAEGRRLCRARGRRPSLRPVAGRLSELLGQEVAFAGDVAGESAAGTGRRPGRRRGGAAGERAVRTRRDQQGRRGAGRAGEQAGRSRRPVRRGRVRGHAPQACQRLRRARAAPACGRATGALGDLGAPPAHHRPVTALCGRARRRQDLRQARGHRQPGQASRPVAHRGWNGLHVPGRPGPPGGRLAAGNRSDPAGTRRAGRGGFGWRGDRAAGGSCGGGPVRRRRRAQRRPGDDIPHGKLALDIGPATRALFAAEARRRQDGVLERPDGVFEFPPFAEGTRAVAEAITAVPGLTVVGGGDSAAAVRRLGFRRLLRSPTSPPAAVPAWSSSRGARCPGLAVLEDP